MMKMEGSHCKYKKMFKKVQQVTGLEKSKKNCIRMKRRMHI